MNRARALATGCIAAAAGAHCAATQAQIAPVVDADLRTQANAVLTITSYQVIPDATASSLSISNAASGNPGFRINQIGGGFTVSESLPIYLEGSLGASRYDPQFISSANGGGLHVPVKWDATTATGGIGWDFALAPRFVLRPIFNIAIGRIGSELRIPSTEFGRSSGSASDFLADGHLDVAGAGGSLMLVYRDHRPRDEFDAEFRYTAIRLRSTSSSTPALEGSADASTLSAWGRWRRASGFAAFDRPIRYVVEAAHSEFVGSQRGALGFDRLSSIGAGLEIDLSGRHVWVERARVVVRHLFGTGVSGSSVGLAVSFQG